MGGPVSRWANLAGALGLFGAVAAVAVGLPALNRQIPAVRAVADGRYEVGAGISVLPPAGAAVDVTGTRPGPTQGSVLFLLGSVRYVVVASGPTLPGGPKSLVEAERRVRQKIAKIRGYQVTGGTTPISTRQGVTGRQGSYTSPGRCGWYAVFYSPAGVAEVTVSGTDQALRGAMAPIQASVAGLRFKALAD